VGGRVKVQYTKWDGRLHWHFDLDVLGEDAYGLWLAARPGCVLQRGSEPSRVERDGVACLVPHVGRWIAYFNLSNDPPVYIDVTDLPVVADGIVRAIDIDLDVVRLPDGTVFIDDEDEFVEHQALFAYPPDVVAATRATADALAADVRGRVEPFGDASLPWLARVAAAPYDTSAIRRAYAAFPGGASEYAARFGEDIVRNEFDRGIIDEAIGDAARVLDVGCGPAQVASYVESRGMFGVGVDLTAEMLVAAQARLGTPPLVNGDVLSLPFGSSSFDTAVAWYSVHNLPRAVLRAAVVELARVVRSGGTLLITTHGGEGETEHHYDGPAGADTVLMTYYSLDELAAVVAGCGFTEVRRFQRPPEPHEHQATKISLLARR
jgi:SAM-dependent methyltransferase